MISDKVRQPIPFGKYLLLDRVSVGGMAEVFRAKSYGVEGFEKLLAIKRILPSMGEDRDFIKMFIDEAKIVGQLSHTNICQIFELGKINEAHFIAMEYIWGKDLLQMFNRQKKTGKPMPAPMACYILAKVCEGLGYAHRKRDPMGQPLEIVHRDCSPQNILVSYEGEVKIIDFGIAKAASRSSRTMAGVLKGKFGYMSPEQVRGLPLDRRTDIFSLGTILYECLTGSRLFQGESDFSTLEKVRNVDIQPPRRLNASIPPAVEKVVMKALAGDVDQRYQWCHEMAADLQRYLMTEAQVYSNKTLSGWMKRAFHPEHEREQKQLEEYKKLGRDGKVPMAPEPSAGDSLLDGLATMADNDDIGEATTIGDPGFADILGGGRASTELNDDFADEGPTSIYGGELDLGDDDDIMELSVSTAIPIKEDDDVDDEAATVMDDGSLQDLVANLRSGQVPPLAPPPSYGTGATPSPRRRGPGGLPVGGRMTPNASAPIRPQGNGPGRPLGPGGGTGPIGGPGSLSGTGPVPGPNSGLGAGPVGPSSLSGPMDLAKMSANRDMGDLSAPVFGATSNVPPLPPGPAQKKAGKRSSLGRDIGIGFGIAVLVLALFAAGKMFLFKDKGSEAAKAPQKGIVAVTLATGGAADVFVGTEKRGTVTPDKSLQLELELGTHTIKVTRDDAEPCEREVELDDASVEKKVACELKTKAPPTGMLKLDKVSPEFKVSVDGKELSEVDKSKPITLSADEAHAVVIERDGKRAELSVTVKAGQEEVRDVEKELAEAIKLAAAKKPDDKPEDKKPDDKPEDKKPDDKPEDKKPEDKKPVEKKVVRKPPAPKKGYLTAFTTPWAQVHIDGKNTGKTTPIQKAKKIPLTPGKHKVTFVVGGTKKSFTVNIKAGKTTKLVKILE